MGRRAAERDGALAAALARAFRDDPALAYILPDPAARTARLPDLFAVFLSDDARTGHVTRIGDEAAATWRPPGATHPAATTLIRHAPMLARIFGWRTLAALALDRAIAAHQPREPFWYLHILGCDPAAQRRGLASAVIEEGLARVAADRLPCFLETANPANLPFYRHHGFHVIASWQAPGGLLFRGLRRPAG